MKWRPISEAPDTDRDMLLWVDGSALVGHRAYEKGMRSRGWWYCELETIGEYLRPTHWMPLPEPPEVG